MELEEFRNDLLQQVGVIAAADENFRHSAFVEHVAELLAEAGEVSDFEPCHYRGTGLRNRALGVDGYALDEADDSLRMFLADFRDSATCETLTQTGAQSQFSRLRAFVEDAIDGRLVQTLEESSPAHGLATLLQQTFPTRGRVRLYLITDALMSTRIRDLPEERIRRLPLEFHIWDIARFHRLVESRSGRDELEVDFTSLTAEGLPCIEASIGTSDYKAYLCVISGSALAKVYDTWGSRLLEGNVRSFLGTRSKINKDIRKTLRVEPHMFFAYNNGIATTASAATVAETRGGLRLLKASDLQIVNGGQTTASLALAMRENAASLGATFVQMKLSVVSAETEGQIVPRISKCANSQNKMNDADFFSNHDFHRRVELIAQRVWAPSTGGAQHETHWFYERARGQYANEQANRSATARNRFLALNPRHQVMTKTDLAKYENAWSQKPHVVSQGAQKNFLAFAAQVSQEWEQKSDQFNDEYYRAIVVKAILFRRTERLVSSQPWYDGGYRANIVAYTLAKLSQMIDAHPGNLALDTSRYWAAQSSSEALEAQLRVVSEAMVRVITNPQGGFQNVTEWCKKGICWQRATEAVVAVLPGFAAELIGRDEEHASRRGAREEQRTMTGIEAQTQVVQLGPAYWAKLRQWAERNGHPGPEDMRLLALAAEMPRRLPNAYQGTRLLRVKQELEEEGYEGE